MTTTAKQTVALALNHLRANRIDSATDLINAYVAEGKTDRAQDRRVDLILAAAPLDCGSGTWTLDRSYKFCDACGAPHPKHVALCADCREEATK